MWGSIPHRARNLHQSGGEYRYKMRDPAFLFYPADFLVGASGLTMEERGQYITILCLQHQKGRLSEKTIRLSLNLKSLSEISGDVIEKFCIDENGLYYNKRLEHEIGKRAKSANASRNNGKLGGRPAKEKEPSENLQVISRFGNEEPKESLSVNDSMDKKPSSANVLIAEDEDENVRIIIDYLNTKVGSNYRHTSKSTNKLIKARLGENYDIKAFFDVIDKKVADWKYDPKQSIYLRPKTLFSETNFDNYVNQPWSNGQTLNETQRAAIEFASRSNDVEEGEVVAVIDTEKEDLY